MFFGALYTSQHIYQPVFDGYLGNAAEVSLILMFVAKGISSRGGGCHALGIRSQNPNPQDGAEFLRCEIFFMRRSRLFVEFTGYEPDNQVILTSKGWI